MTTPPRRRFRFSLRTFFVVVALFSAWLAWQASIVRERRAVLTWLESRDPTETSFDDSWSILVHGTMFSFPDAGQQSWFQRLMNDAQPPRHRWCQPYASPAEIERVKAAFPGVDVEQRLPK